MEYTGFSALHNAGAKSLFACAALAIGGAAFAAGEAQIALRPGERGPDVPKTLYGIFFEDINYSADGGIYPELVANRGFDWDNGSTHGWENDFRGGAQARISIEHGRPVHEVTASHVRIDAYGAGGGRGAGLRNRGYHGMYVEKGKKYDLSFYVRGIDGYKGGVRVVLEADGRVLAEKRLANSEMNVGRARGDAIFPELPEWTRAETVFEPSETTRQATLSILADSAGIVEFEQVSLFPQDTFNGRKNGLRRDLVQMLKDLKPGIMRFPGGCLVEGRDWNLWYDWKISVGDGSLESRRCIWNTWDYWQTMGLGYFEYFCLCEDLGCEPLPVMASGLTCQFAKPVDAAPMESMPYFAQNLLDLIEFANGDASTKWGALRAKMGHPRPFNMKYLGIGNENWDQVFLDRFEAIAKVVRAKHPEIRIVSSSGPGPDGHSFDYAWKRLDTKLADVIDEHYYRPPEWFREQGGRYDGYDRSGKKPNVYAGEYACHVRSKDNNLYSALCEAGAMTGFERNCDVVEMTSYAPLFAKVDSYKWKPDLIWFDNAGCFGTPNYYVQQMFGVNRPTRVVPSSETVSGDASFSCEGELALHTWNTAAEFKDLKVVDGSGRSLLSAMPDPSRCRVERGGRWTLSGGVLRQENAGATDTALTLPCGAVGDATVTFKARRTAGSEGFLFRFRAKDGRHAHVNFGGWMNTEHGIEALGFSASLPPRVAGSLENNRWYDVKVVLRGDTVTASLDGREIFSAARVTERAQKEFFHVCGFDAEKGELVVKCVNISDEARPLTIDFGTALKPGEAKRIELSGKSGDVNDLANPRRVAPVERTFRFDGGRRLRTELAPNSLTVFRLRASL